MSVQLKNQSTRWMWISIGTAGLLTMSAATIALLTALRGWDVPLMNFTFMVTIVVWLGALIYSAVWWMRRYIAKAVKSMRKQLSEDVITVMNVQNVDRWLQVAEAAEPRLKAVPSRVGRS